MPLSDTRTSRIITSEDLGISTGQLVPFSYTFLKSDFVVAQLLYVTNIYLSDATVATRLPSCAITTPSGQLAWNMISQSTVTASQSEQIYWAQGEQTQGFFTNILPRRLARQFYVFPGYSIRFDSLTVGPGDLQSPFFSLRAF